MESHCLEATPQIDHGRGANMTMAVKSDDAFVRRISINGVGIACLVRGAGRPMVLIHGNSMSRKLWDPLIKHYVDAFTIIAPDLRGHGESDKPRQAYAIQSFADDIAALLMELGLGPAIVVGHSMGGRIAMQLALDHRDLLVAAVLLNTSPAPFAGWRSQQQRMVDVGAAAELREFVDFMSGGSATDELASWLVEDMERTPSWVRSELWVSVGQFDVRNRLPEIDAPVLIVAGDWDRGATLDESKMMHQLIGGSRLVVLKNMAHLALITHPSLIYEPMDEFLRVSLPPP